MRIRFIALAILAGTAAGNWPAPAGADRAATSSATSPQPTRALAPIDMAALPPVLTDIEDVANNALLGGRICTRVRTIRSWIPRRVCFPSYALPTDWRATRGNPALRELYRESRRGRMYRSLYSRF